jgi:hypothetical protein
MASTFAGFPTETLQFLKTLKRNNDREWFQKNKALSCVSCAVRWSCRSEPGIGSESGN